MSLVSQFTNKFIEKEKNIEACMLILTGWKCVYGNVWPPAEELHEGRHYIKSCFGIHAVYLHTYHYIYIEGKQVKNKKKIEMLINKLSLLSFDIQSSSFSAGQFKFSCSHQSSYNKVIWQTQVQGNLSIISLLKELNKVYR